MAKPKLKFDLCGENNPDKVRLFAKTKKFHVNDLISLKPKNKRQEQFLQSYYQQIPLIIQDGCAGTGKTFLAIYAALSEVFEPSTPYHKVIIFRSAVECRKIGFLPGNEEEKAAAFEAPYEVIFNQVVGSYDQSYKNAKALGLLEFKLTTHQRGMTYDNAIMIIDEVQNMDESEIRTILSRTGEHSRVIVCGDSAQDDLFRYREKSGFAYLKAVARMMPYDSTDVITYKLDDIVRSGFVREFLIADHLLAEKHRN